MFEYFLRLIKKRICKTEKFKFYKVCSFMHSILGRGSFSTNSSISEVWHGSDQPVALDFSSSGLLDKQFLIFLLKISHIFHMGFRSGMLAGQSSTVDQYQVQYHGQQTTWKWFWQCGQVLKSCWKMKSASP